MPGSNTHSCVYSISLRLLAVIGILLILEQWSAHYLAGRDRQQSALTGYGLDVDSYKDGRKFNALKNVTSIRRKSKAIVAASVKGDNVSWMGDYFHDWENNVYVMNDPDAEMTVAKNKGNEASAYLTYLITHYHNLPDHMVFIHARRYQWHNEDPMYDHVPVLQNLRLQHVTDVGYASLRCTWNPGCPIGIRPDINAQDGFFGIRSAYVETFETLLPKMTVPREVGSPCCAQFAVSRDRVRERPVTEYEQLRQWIWDSDLPAGRSGRILEYLWHIVFGRDAVNCAPAKGCFCDKFGLCDLDCDNDAECKKRWWLPRWDQELPKEWPNKGQGEKGWPVDKWWEIDGTS